MYCFKKGWHVNELRRQKSNIFLSTRVINQVHQTDVNFSFFIFCLFFNIFNHSWTASNIHWEHPCRNIKQVEVLRFSGICAPVLLFLLLLLLLISCCSHDHCSDPHGFHTVCCFCRAHSASMSSFRKKNTSSSTASSHLFLHPLL